MSKTEETLVIGHIAWRSKMEEQEMMNQLWEEYFASMEDDSEE